MFESLKREMASLRLGFVFSIMLHLSVVLLIILAMLQDHSLPIMPEGSLDVEIINGGGAFTADVQSEQENVTNQGTNQKISEIAKAKTEQESAPIKIEQQTFEQEKPVPQQADKQVEADKEAEEALASKIKKAQEKEEIEKAAEQAAIAKAVKEKAELEKKLTEEAEKEKLEREKREIAEKEQAEKALKEAQAKEEAFKKAAAAEKLEREKELEEKQELAKKESEQKAIKEAEAKKEAELKEKLIKAEAEKTAKEKAIKEAAAKAAVEKAIKDAEAKKAAEETAKKVALAKAEAAKKAAAEKAQKEAAAKVAAQIAAAEKAEKAKASQAAAAKAAAAKAAAAKAQAAKDAAAKAKIDSLINGAGQNNKNANQQGTKQAVSNAGGAKGPQGDTNAAKATRVGGGLTWGEKDALRAAINKCWSAGMIGGITVKVEFALDKSGRVTGSVRQLGANGGNPAQQAAAFRRAKMAIMNCGPYGSVLPSSKFDVWNEVEVNFTDQRVAVN